MYYPTHSMSMIVSVTGAHATGVSGQGFADTEAEIFGAVNRMGTRFSNETALFKPCVGREQLPDQ